MIYFIKVKEFRNHSNKKGEKKIEAEYWKKMNEKKKRPKFVSLNSFDKELEEAQHLLKLSLVTCVSSVMPV